MAHFVFTPLYGLDLGRNNISQYIHYIIVKTSPERTSSDLFSSLNIEASAGDFTHPKFKQGKPHLREVGVFTFRQKKTPS
jgi:hypothetical protein